MVTVTLTSGLSPSISPQISVWMHFSVVDCSILFWGTETLTYTSDFGILKSCVEHNIISFIRYTRDTYRGIGMLHTVLGYCEFDLWPPYSKNRIPIIPSRLYEVTISNFVRGCILIFKCNILLFGNRDLDL